jgi:hypothetical protein
MHTAEDVIRRIAAECAYIDERGGVGIQFQPAAALVRQYAENSARDRRPCRVSRAGDAIRSRLC